MASTSKRRWTLLRLITHRAGFVALVFLLLLAAATLLAPVIAPYEPSAIDPANTLDPPSSLHLFGTDQLGRDVLSRILFGGRITLSVAIVAVMLASVLGSIFGLMAGYLEGPVSTVIMRLTDVWLALPTILLVLAIVTALGPSLTNTTLAIAVSTVPAYTRVVAGATLLAKQYEYVEAARSLGVRTLRLVRRHVLPEIVPPIVVYSTLAMATAILLTSGLSFIGLGPPPPTAEWGAMLASARGHIYDAWWMVTFPGLAISFTVLAINILGDALRDIHDPRL